MPITLYRTAWGLVGPDLAWPDLATFTRDAARDGYAGVEFALPLLDLWPTPAEKTLTDLEAALADTGLAVMPLIATRPTHAADYGDRALHFDSFRSQLAVAARLRAPRVVVHGGADSFSRSEAEGFFRDCMVAAEDANILPMFETHRGRPLFSPWATADLMAALPEMRLTSDLSHWMPVVDRWPTDVIGIFEEASRRSWHLHARVGHEKGPQIPQPRDPVWDAHTELHKSWWQITHDAAQARGEALTAAPEFGPPPYMHATPYDNAPVADLIDVNAWMRAKLETWFA